MGKAIQVPVPEQVRHPLFFDEEITTLNIEKEDPLDPLFRYEILFYNDIPQDFFPWEYSKSIKELVLQWDSLQRELKDAFSERSAAKVKSLMKKGIALFLMFLFWTNRLPASPSAWKEKLPALQVKPVNVEERLEFILLQPALYPSYKQLEQLLTEQIKQYAKHLAMSKKRE